MISRKRQSVLKDRVFIRKVMIVALPMIFQQLITSSVNLLDNLMVGQLGAAAIGAVASTNKYLMVASFGMMGIATAATIFLAQFKGAGKIKEMKESFRYAIVFSLLVVSIFVLFALAFPSAILRFFSKDQNLIQVGLKYIYIAALTMLPQSVSYSVQSSMRSVGSTKIPLASSIISLLTNGFMNYCLIFGKFGFPQLGVMGAAIGTLIARFAELIFLLIMLKKRNFDFKSRVLDIFNIPKKRIMDITKKAMPLFLNETAWAGGMAVLFKFYASPGDQALAALPIASTTSDLFFVLFSGVAVSTIVMVSHPLGSNDIDLARENGYKMVELSIYLAILFGIGLIGASFITPHFYNIDQEVFNLATNFIRIQAVFFWIYMYNAQIFFVLRSGGDTRSTLLMDAGTMWLICIPVVGIVAYFTNASPIVIYIVGQATDLIKMVIATYYFKKEKWLLNLTK